MDKETNRKVSMKKVIIPLFVLIISLMTGMPVFAGDAPEEGFNYSGYMRGGVAGNAEGHAVPGANQMKADGAYNNSRFGNESNYSEHELSYTGYGDEMWWKVATRIAFDFPGFPEGWHNLSDYGYGIIMPEAYVRMGWFDKSVSVWAGNRYNDSIAIDLYDYYINDLSSAYGVGVDGIDLNRLTLDAAYLMSYNADDPTETLHSFVLHPHIPVGPGTFSFKAVPTIATGTDGSKGGAILEATYGMNSFFGLLEGSTQIFGYYDFGTGINDVKYTYVDMDAYRAGGGVQGSAVFNEKWSMKTAAFVEARGNQNSEESADGVWTSFALRPYYAFTKTFGLTAEYDFDHFSYAADSTTSTVNRFTLAPTITLDSSGTVFSNPVIQFYMTYAVGDLDQTAAENVLLDGKDDMGFKYGVSFTVSW